MHYNIVICAGNDKSHNHIFLNEIRCLGYAATKEWGNGSPFFDLHGSLNAVSRKGES